MAVIKVIILEESYQHGYDIRCSLECPVVRWLEGYKQVQTFVASKKSKRSNSEVKVYEIQVKMQSLINNFCQECPVVILFGRKGMNWEGNILN